MEIAVYTAAGEKILDLGEPILPEATGIRRVPGILKQNSHEPAAEGLF
ncbi:hypothetical protein [Streptomyces rubellomurinus]|nr:hypothetical protein [Streptomyces rubellomurinus]